MLTTSEPSEYTLTFTPNNPLPTDGSILVQYPMQVELIDGESTACTVSTSLDTFDTKCQFITSSSSIVIKDIFSGDYSGPITIVLGNVRNPVSNKPGNGFVIQTYSDQD